MAREITKEVKYINRVIRNFKIDTEVPFRLQLWLKLYLYRIKKYNISTLGEIIDVHYTKDKNDRTKIGFIFENNENEKKHKDISKTNETYHLPSTSEIFLISSDTFKKFCRNNKFSDYYEYNIRQYINIMNRK